MYNIIIIFILASTFIALIYSYYNYLHVVNISIENKEMARIASLISEGASTFLKRQYKVLIYFIIFIAFILFIINFNNKYCIIQAFTFIFGAFVSGFTGFLGMSVATKANLRTASYAQKGLIDSLHIAFRGGSIMGLCTASFALLSLTFIYFIVFQLTKSINITLHILVGFSMGASSIALFSRVGGGIYTKAADISADLVGKIETKLPEDDPRNPAVIADNVGDNVGDIAGMGADLFESYAGAIIATMIIGSTLSSISTPSLKIFILLPIILAGIGILVSILGIVFILNSVHQNPQYILNAGNNLTVSLMILSSFIIIYFLIPQTFFSLIENKDFNGLGLFISIITGILTGVGIGWSTEHYCSKNSATVNEIVKSSISGHATNVITGIAVGMKSTVIPIILMSMAILLSDYCAGIYGISLAAVGMLSTVGMQLAIDAYGPIVDNAGGIAVMAKMSTSVRKNTDHLDSIGNTTAAIGKGFAIGSAALTAFALFNAYQSKIAIYSSKITIDISKPHVMVGMLIGGMLTFLFSYFTISAVSKAAKTIIIEIRSQFKKSPEILRGEKFPNYTKCIDISTIAALQGMIKPGLLAIFIPIFAGLLDKTGLLLAGIMAGTTVTGVLIAIFMANAGGAWDNAKKQIEENMRLQNKSYKNKILTLQYDASITGDTVGDPFKDTAGPSINILIKLMNIVSLMFIPIMTKYGIEIFL